MSFNVLGSGFVFWTYVWKTVKVDFPSEAREIFHLPMQRNKERGPCMPTNSEMHFWAPSLARSNRAELLHFSSICLILSLSKLAVSDGPWSTVRPTPIRGISAMDASFSICCLVFCLCSREGLQTEEKQTAFWQMDAIKIAGSVCQRVFICLSFCIGFIAEFPYRT